MGKYRYVTQVENREPQQIEWSEQRRGKDRQAGGTGL